MVVCVMFGCASGAGMTLAPVPVLRKRKQGGGVSDNSAMKRGGAGGSGGSGGMAGGRRDSGRGDDTRRQPASASRSRYSDREWRSDYRIHRYSMCSVVVCGYTCGLCTFLCDVSVCDSLLYQIFV